MASISITRYLRKTFPPFYFFFFSQEIKVWNFWLTGVVSIVLCGFGFVGNVFAVVVMMVPSK